MPTLMGFAIPFYPAHGMLGYWDELIFLSVIVIFFVMMVVSWFRSRNMDFPEEELPQFQRRKRTTPPTDKKQASTTDTPESDTRFKLD